MSQLIEGLDAVRGLGQALLKYGQSGRDDDRVAVIRATDVDALAALSRFQRPAMTDTALAFVASLINSPRKAMVPAVAKADVNSRSAVAIALGMALVTTANAQISHFRTCAASTDDRVRRVS